MIRRMWIWLVEYSFETFFVFFLAALVTLAVDAPRTVTLAFAAAGAPAFWISLLSERDPRGRYAGTRSAAKVVGIAGVVSLMPIDWLFDRSWHECLTGDAGIPLALWAWAGASLLLASGVLLLSIPLRELAGLGNARRPANG